MAALNEPYSPPRSNEIIYPCPLERLSPDAFEGGQREYEAIKARTELGDRLGVLLIDGRVAHRGLVQVNGFAALDGDRRAIALQPGQFYIHYCETAPHFRGEGLYPTMLRRIISSSCRETEFREALIGCRQENLSSVKGILRAGFAYRYSCFTIGLFGDRLALNHIYVKELKSS
jgi:hypothetical protein